MDGLYKNKTADVKIFYSKLKETTQFLVLIFTATVMKAVHLFKSSLGFYWHTL